ncbi:MaoC family dehydratase [Clostridium merdae]|uniref:MaoC family dehydratase n=1 Tax=Clostridium merdae TaxID=1958780 RepID=UPI000A26A9C6|nr:MaoC family dehydratase [Clostridium merdae]
MRTLTVGDSAQRSKRFTKQDLIDYIRLTGDQNPLHKMESGECRFGAPIVHGMLLAGVISALIGTQLPGPGSVYVSQEIRFIRPVFCGDTVTAICRVTQLYSDTKQARLRITMRNQEDKLVLSGYAIVLPPA